MLFAGRELDVERWARTRRHRLVVIRARPIHARSVEVIDGGVVISGAVGVIVGGLIGWSLRAWQRRMTRSAVFAYDILAFLVLVLLAASYLRQGTGWSVRIWIPSPFQDLPITAIWFGALGGTMISLKGVYDHDQTEWVDKLNLWHLGRPITSGVSGGMTYLFLRFISGSTPTGVAVYVAAFIIGMQERRFLALLSKVAGLVLSTPGEQSPATAASPTVQPSRTSVNGPTGVAIPGSESSIAAHEDSETDTDPAVHRPKVP